jgi:7-cyano-7-deazaguanine reductase
MSDEFIPTPERSPLGRPTAYVDRYDPTLLYPLPRAPGRAELGITGTVPFLGADLWTAFELGWLNPRGKPQVAIAHVTVPADSSHIVESKSFKLYLNSFNNTRFDSAEAVRETIRRDLSQAVWHGGPVRSMVGVRVLESALFETETIQPLEGLLLDRLDVECDRYEPDPGLLRAAHEEAPVSEVLVSHLLRSHCPVTHQPDWGSLQISYTGPQIDQEGLLRYIVSLREHHGFHEQCVERIYMDILRRCRPTRLSVYARFTRRGGLDINPWRASHPQLPPPHVRTARQ